MQDSLVCNHITPVGNRQRVQIADYYRFQIPIELGESALRTLFVTTKHQLESFFESRLDQVRRSRVSLFEALPLLGHFVSKRLQLRGNLIERSCPIVDAAQLGLEVGTEHADEDLAAEVPRWPVENLIGGIENRPEKFQFLA